MNINTLSEYLSASNDIKTTCRNTFSIEQWINILIKDSKISQFIKIDTLENGIKCIPKSNNCEWFFTNEYNNCYYKSMNKKLENIMFNSDINELVLTTTAIIDQFNNPVTITTKLEEYEFKKCINNYIKYIQNPDYYNLCANFFTLFDKWFLDEFILDTTNPNHPFHSSIKYDFDKASIGGKISRILFIREQFKKLKTNIETLKDILNKVSDNSLIKKNLKYIAEVNLITQLDDYLPIIRQNLFDLKVLESQMKKLRSKCLNSLSNIVQFYNYITESIKIANNINMMIEDIQVDTTYNCGIIQHLDTSIQLLKLYTEYQKQTFEDIIKRCMNGIGTDINNKIRINEFICFMKFVKYWINIEFAKLQLKSIFTFNYNKQSQINEEINKLRWWFPDTIKNIEDKHMVYQYKIDILKNIFWLGLVLLLIIQCLLSIGSITIVKRQIKFLNK